MWWIVILLIIIGIALLVLEVLVIPGVGVVGFVGFAMMVAGVWISYTDIGIAEGNTVLISTVLLNVIGVVLMLRSKTWKNAMLKTQIRGKVNVVDTDKIKEGDRGVSVSRCTPMGKARINNILLEVSSQSEFIDEGTDIEVFMIKGNKVYIKTI